MKKTLIATAATIACASAFSQVTLYGVADAGITRVTGYAQGSVTQLNSGIMDGSRWGIKGSEDLGGGYKALFTLESRVELDTGGLGNRPTSGNQLADRLTAGLPPALAAGLTNAAIGPTLGVNHLSATQSFFDRQAWFGLVTPIGGFLMGRQYTPAYETVATFDIMRTESALAAGQVASIPSGVDIRYNNALQYRIVKGPWNASLMYGFGERANSSGSRLLGINTIYKTETLSAGFGYNTKKNSAGEQALKTMLVGASGTQGGWTLSGLLGRIEEPNPSSGPELTAGLTALGAGALAPTVLARLKQDANLMHVGLRYNMGAAGQVTVAYTKLNDKQAANADTASYGVAYTYPLSKRTTLNAVLTRFNNSGTGQAAPGGAGYLGGVTGTAGQDSTSLALGVRHVF
jgi:predicted porin